VANFCALIPAEWDVRKPDPLRTWSLVQGYS
jgi:hypothetical protein